MFEQTHIGRSACKHGVTYQDIQSALDRPVAVQVALPDRPNVVVAAGYDTYGHPLVVFVDRFENIVFHSESGTGKYRFLFD